MRKKIYKSLFGVILALAMLMQLAMPCFATDEEEMYVTGMTICDKNGKIDHYVDMNKGWMAAVEKAKKGGLITLKLHSNWIADAEKGFYCVGDDDDEFGTDNGCLYLSDEDINMTIDLNGKTISRNLTSATDDGHVFWINGSTLTITDTSTSQTGKITGAYSDEEGGAFYMQDQDSVVYIKGGTICGNKATKGGAFFVYNGSLYIEGGTITDNMAINGGGIYWESRNNLVMTGGTIKGNTSTDHGGGVYVTDWGNAYIGGSLVVKDNMSNYGGENIYLPNDKVALRHTANQISSIPDAPFAEGAYIGISCGYFNGDRQINKSSAYFPINTPEYVFADDAGCCIYTASVESQDGYAVYISPRKDGVMYVERFGTEPVAFDNFNEGWVYALKESAKDATVLTLGTDWYAPGGYFYCTDENGKEFGTDNGRLLVDDSDIFLSIDLRGHTISRNLANPVEHGQVFRVKNGQIIISDSSLDKTGIITGGNNNGNGGAFYVDGGILRIEDGTITGNKCTGNGAGVYWNSDGTFKMTDGYIKGNTAIGHGGGVYVAPGKCIGLGRVGVIMDNIGDGRAENIYLSDETARIRHIAATYNTWDALRPGAMYGISVGKISSKVRISSENTPDRNYFNISSAQYFTSDVPGYAIECEEDSSTGYYHLNLCSKYEGYMFVISDGEARSFSDFAEGWIYAVNKSKEKPTKITLEANWIAPAGKFYFVDSNGKECGTENGRLYLNDSNINLTINLNGYTISRNLANPVEHGQVFRVKAGTLTIMDSSEEGTGTITGGNNNGDGGAFYMDNGSLYINGGNITGNKCTGNGAGVYWYSSGKFAMTGGSITANEADGLGGGIFIDYDGICVGGTTYIQDNTAKGKPNNVYLNGASRYINHIYEMPLSEGANIGVTCDKIVHYEDISTSDSGFLADSVKYFTADNKMYVADSQTDSNGKVKISLTYNQGGSMYVAVDGEGTKEFLDFGKGWIYAVKKSTEKPTTIKLGADWNSDGANFCYLNDDRSETNTDTGRLYLNDSDIKLTIDLNGHEIRRNLTEAVEHGEVIRLKSGNLTIDDTSEGKNGIITGGYNRGNGGGMYMDNNSTLTLKGGSFSGNRVQYVESILTMYGNGGGIWAGESTIIIDGGNVSNNYAESHGGGIFTEGCNVTLLSGSISGNEAREGGGICVYNESIFTMEGGDITGNIANDSGGGISAHSQDWVIFTKVYLKGGTIADNVSSSAGGGICLNPYNTSFYMTGGSIIRNSASGKGGGIFDYGCATTVLTGGVITENEAREYPDSLYKRGGAGVSVFYTGEESNPYVGGTIQIYGNKAAFRNADGIIEMVESNLNTSDTDSTIRHAMGQQDDVPNMPLAEGAYVGLSILEDHSPIITDKNSKFDEASLKYLHADNPEYYIKAENDSSYASGTFRLLLVPDFKIKSYDAQKKTATVYVPEAGKYALVFARYTYGEIQNEDGTTTQYKKLVVADVVECDFVKGENTILQNNLNFALQSGDKVMLWYDMENIVPACGEFVVE